MCPDSSQTTRLLFKTAILVAVRLGFRYLWVDWYCIPPEHRQAQINRMDAVYIKSALTIIAAAGSGLDHGLPGVRACHRIIPGQEVMKINQYHLLGWISTTAQAAIHSSTCDKRGWTYQEAILSRQLLIFTPEFVAHQTPHGTQDCVLHRGFVKCIYGVNVNRWPKDWGHLEQLTLHANNYMRREVSFDLDIHNAFRGIQRMLSRDVKGYTFLYGLPMSNKCDGIRLVNGLLWSFGSRDKCSLVTRRCGAPSWSWLGWKINSSDALVDGPKWPIFAKEYPFVRKVRHSFNEIPSLNIQLAFPDGLIVP